MPSPSSLFRTSEHGTSDSWWQHAFNDLFRLESLGADGPTWQAKIPTAEAREAAKRLLRVLKDLPELRNLSAPFVVPTLAHGVQFEWHRGNRELEVELDAAGREIEFLTVDERGLRREGQLPVDDLSDVRRLLCWLIE